MARYTTQIHTVEKHDVCTCPEVRRWMTSHRHKSRALRSARLLNSKLGCARHVVVVVHHSAGQGDHVEGQGGVGGGEHERQ